MGHVSVQGMQPVWSIALRICHPCIRSTLSPMYPVRTRPRSPPKKFKPSGIDSLGNVPESWTVTRVWLERVAGSLELQDGNHGELHPTAEDYVPDGIPFVMANDIVSGVPTSDFGACKFLEPELADSLRIGFAREGDVLLTHKGTIGRVGMVQPNPYRYVMLTPQVTYYRCVRKISNRFLFWSMQGTFWQDQMLLVSGLGPDSGLCRTSRSETLGAAPAAVE